VARALLDTDLIIWYLRGRQHARQWVDQLTPEGVPCCCALSVTEIVLGMRPGEAAATRGLLNALTVIPVDRRIAWRASELIRDYARRGVTLDFVDATIAATCLIYGLVLATYNVRHYPMSGLQKAAPPS
jgi:predicted nucleic acid-binding protein